MVKAVKFLSLWAAELLSWPHTCTSRKASLNSVAKSAVRRITLASAKQTFPAKSLDAITKLTQDCEKSFNVRLLLTFNDMEPEILAHVMLE